MSRWRSDVTGRADVSCGAVRTGSALGMSQVSFRVDDENKKGPADIGGAFWKQKVRTICRELSSRIVLLTMAIPKVRSRLPQHLVVAPVTLPDVSRVHFRESFAL
jgi:hypothetical protein